MSNLERKWIRTNENPAVDLMRKTNNLSPFKRLICLVSTGIFMKKLTKFSDQTAGKGMVNFRSINSFL